MHEEERQRGSMAVYNKRKIKKIREEEGMNKEAMNGGGREGGMAV